jgi:hypothetical protein
MNPVEPKPFLQFFNRVQRIALIVGIAGFLLAVVGGLLGGFNQFFQSYLVSYVDWIGLSLGSLAILMLHFVGGGRWAGTIRRILEASTKTIWLMALLFIPIALGPVLFGVGNLYSWANPAAVAADPNLQYKSFYLNPGFFILRAVVMFAIWFLVVYFLARWSRQEENGDPLARRKEGRLSSAGLILYFITVTIAAFDWIMSVFPSWNSSIFGLLIAASQALASMGFALVILPQMPGFHAGEMDPHSIKTKLLRDLGALELTFVVLWAYLSFFQLLIIWAGNIPQETAWYATRISNGWLPVALLIALVQFILPFLALIPMRVRSNLGLLNLIALIILVINWVNYYWIIIPAFYPAFHISWVDIVMPIGMGGLWIAAFLYHLKRRSLQPYWDMPMEAEHAQEVQQ